MKKTQDELTSALSQEELKRNLHYDPLTGIITRLICNHYRGVVGEIAGTVVKVVGRPTYIFIKIHNKPYKAHRLAWLYMTGKFPTEYVDHIDGNGINNKWINLREATPQENSRNQKISAKNTSKFPGVHFDKNSGKWMARSNNITKRIYLGLFFTPEEASEARENYAKQNFGEFYRKVV